MEYELKKKTFWSYLKHQNIYSLLIIFIAIIGISYAIVFFNDLKEVTTGSLSNGLVSVETINDGTISLISSAPTSDENGIKQISEVVSIKNTSNTDLEVKIKVIPNESNTITTSDIRYGVYANNYLVSDAKAFPSDNVVYEGIILLGETVNVGINLWVSESYTGSGTTFDGTIELDTKAADMLGADFIERSVDKNNGLVAINTDGNLYTGTGTIREYRYSGTDVDNYVGLIVKMEQQEAVKTVNYGEY